MPHIRISVREYCRHGAQRPRRARSDRRAACERRALGRASSIADTFRRRRLLPDRSAACALAPRCARRSGRHTTALVGALATRRRALPAVIHVVSLALLGARIATLGADPTDCRCELAAAAHEAGGRAADGGAIDVQGDTARHTADVRFLQTGGRTVIAGDRAIVTGVDAGLHGLVRHDHSER